MDKEIKSIIDKYVESVNKKVQRKPHVWLAIAWNIFLASGGQSLNDFNKIKEILPQDTTSEDISFDNVLSETETKLLDRYTKEIIDFCCHQFDSQPFTYNSLHHEGTSLARLMVEIANPQPEDNIYLPFSGMGEVASILPEYAVVTQAEELDPTIWAIGQIRLFIHRKQFDIYRNPNTWNFANADSLARMAEMVKPLDATPRHPQDYPPTKFGPFDLIIMSPPTGMDPNEMGTYLHVKAIHNAFRLLKQTGRMVVALPAAYLHHRSTEWLNDFLWAFGAFKSIVFLPGGNRPMSPEDVCVLEITRDRNRSITFVDASSFIETSGTSVLFDTSAISTLCNQTSNGEYVAVIPMNKLVSSNLLPSAYINQTDEYDGESIRLGDCLELIGTPVEGKPDCPNVGFIDLSEDYLNCKIDIDTLVYPRTDEIIYLQTDEKTLFAHLGGIFRIGVFDPSKQLVRKVCWCDNEIKAFRVNENRVMLDYLLRELTSERMAFKFSKNLRGVSMKELPEAFLNLTIPLPSKEDQMKIVFEETRNNLSGAQEALVRAQDQHVIDIRLRKHTLISNIGAYRNQWKTLRKAFDRGGGTVDLNSQVTRAYDDNFYQWMDGMEALFEEINRELKVLTDTKEDFGESVVENPDELISQYCDAKKQTAYMLTAVEEVEPDVLIKIPEKALYRVFDNIVNNAKSHGFTDSTREDYEIRFQTVASSESVTIIIANNGMPLSEDIQPEDVFELGRSTRMYKDTHGGQGGYDIRRILSQYDASVAVESHPDSEFTVVYKLNFKRYYE